MRERVDIAVIGAGAAGLMAAIWAGRSARASGRRASVVALDGARTLGAKILVAGGGRCNVTHHEVDESAYAGSSRHAIKQVLRAFDVPRTVAFFGEIGVELKREETGKLFPVTDDARTVLRALLDAAHDAGVEIRHPWRVDRVEKRPEGGFLIVEQGAGRAIGASRAVLATGGKALPKSGSDGQGYAIAQSLGHTITEPIVPALVPLLLPEGHFLRSLPGITIDAMLELRAASGKCLVSFTNSTLFTHFGLSGPSVLDISRYYLVSRDDGARLVINFLPGETPESFDAALQRLGRRSVSAFFRERLPERLALALCDAADVEPQTPGTALTRERRRTLARTATECELPIAGDRGFTHAEATAGGVPLAELHLQTMESRACPGLHVVGEICDVDGRIGGFNFQWAWSSGYGAGVAAGRGVSARVG